MPLLVDHTTEESKARRRAGNRLALRFWVLVMVVIGILALMEEFVWNPDHTPSPAATAAGAE